MTWSQVVWALSAILCVQVMTGLAVVGLSRREASLERWLPMLVSGAAGVLLATACVDLLPEAVHAADPGLGIWEALLLSLLALFCVQAGAHAFADRAASFQGSSGAGTAGMTDGTALLPGGRGALISGGVRSAPLVLGSALHSTVDGFAIAAAFAANDRLGWGVALAVSLHELPHRMSDFSLLLHLGVRRGSAVLLSIGAGAAAVAGGLGAALLGTTPGMLKWLLPVSAATFLYIALADLVPELHAHRQRRRIWWEIVCLLGGAALMVAFAHTSGV